MIGYALFSVTLTIAFIYMTFKFIHCWITFRAYVMCLIEKGIDETPTEEEMRASTIKVIRHASSDIREKLKL